MRWKTWAEVRVHIYFFFVVRRFAAGEAEEGPGEPDGEEAMGAVALTEMGLGAPTAEV